MLTRLGWTGVLGALAVGGGAFVRLLFRRAPIEPPTVFRAGRIADYRPGEVSIRFLKERRVFLVRDSGAIYAIFARCTHLGCTPRWHAPSDRFQCPCHGSTYTRDGVNVQGPAPRPMERARIWVGADGELRVDVARRFRPDQWEAPGASVRLEGVEERGT